MLSADTERKRVRDCRRFIDRKPSQPSIAHQTQAPSREAARIFEGIEPIDRWRLFSLLHTGEKHSAGYISLLSVIAELQSGKACELLCACPGHIGNEGEMSARERRHTWDPRLTGSQSSGNIQGEVRKLSILPQCSKTSQSLFILTPLVRHSPALSPTSKSTKKNSAREIWPTQ